MAEFTLDIPEFQGMAEEFLEDFTDDVKKEIGINTPEKTWDLLEAIEKWKIEKKWSKYSQDVFIDTDKIDYAEYIENWVWKEVNYHKPAWVTKWKWDWRYMVRDTFLAFQKTIWQNKT